jgi:hypothetical protein
MGAEFRYRANFTFSMRWAKIAPLVLQLIEAVLRIRPVAVQLGHGIQSIATVGHKHRILLRLHILSGQQQFELTFAVVAAERQVGLNRPAQNHYPALFVPSRQFQAVLHRTPSLIARSGLGPVRPLKLTRQQPLHPLGLAQLEQIVLVTLLQLLDKGFIAPIDRIAVGLSTTRTFDELSPPKSPWSPPLWGKGRVGGDSLGAQKGGKQSRLRLTDTESFQTNRLCDLAHVRYFFCR